MRQKNMIRKQLSDEQALTPMVFAELNRAITETEVNAFAEKYAREIERSRCRAKEKQREKIIAEQANSHESKLNSIGYYKIVSVHSNFIRYHIAATETHGTIFKNPGKIPKVFNDPKTGEKYIFIDISRR